MGYTSECGGEGGGGGEGKKSDYQKTGLKGPWSLPPIPTSAEMRQFISHPLLYLAVPDFFPCLSPLWEMRGCVISVRKKIAEVPTMRAEIIAPSRGKRAETKEQIGGRNVVMMSFFLGGGFDTRQLFFSPGYCPLDFFASTRTLNIQGVTHLEYST